jgi:hypothetical protein
MGGGSSVKQTNAAQAAAANAGATAAANNSTALSQQYNTQQQQQYNNLFGANGKSGSVGGFLDPSKLNVTSPTGVYALQKTGADQVAAKQYGQNAANITSAAQQAGFGPGTPSGFVQDQQNRNARSLADTRGTNFGNAVSNQYNDALSNFWKAAGMSQAQGTAAQGGALQGNNTAASTYGNLYGTAGQGHVVENSNLLGNMIGAGGQVGAAAVCCVAGTKIRMVDGTDKPVELLVVGDEVLSADGGRDLVVGITEVMRATLRLATTSGHKLECSYEHALLRPSRGYVNAHEALDEVVMTDGGVTVVSRIEKAQHTLVYSPQLSRTHTYLANGLWSEGW